jgi:hypothetical protein
MVQVVLDYLLYEDISSPEQIAELYAEASAECQRRADSIALQDEQDAQEAATGVEDLGVTIQKKKRSRASNKSILPALSLPVSQPRGLRSSSKT